MGAMAATTTMKEPAWFSAEKFNGMNFIFWKMQIEDYLYQKNLYRPLGGNSKNLATMTDADLEVLDCKTLGTIRLSLSSSVAFSISNEKTTKDLMSTLYRMYEKPSASNKVFLMKRLFNMKMEESRIVAKHLYEFNTVTNQLTSVGINFDNEVKALLILSSLPDSWDGLVMAVSNSSDSSSMKYDDVVSVILSEEVCRKSTSSGETLDSALNMKGRRKTTNKNQDQGRSVLTGKSRSEKPRVEC